MPVLPKLNLDLGSGTDEHDDFVEENEDQLENDQTENQDNNQDNNPDDNEKDDIDFDAKAIYDIYVEEGIFNEKTPFDGSFDSIKTELVNKTEEIEDQLFDSIVNRPPDFAKPFIELAILKGQELTIDEAVEFLNTLVGQSDDLYEKDPERYISDYYKNNLNWEDDEIEERLATLKDKDKVAQEAKSIYTRVSGNKKEALKDTITNARNSYTNNKQIDKEFSQNLNSSISENYSKPRARQLQNEFYSGNFYNKVNKAVRSPDNLRLLLEFMSYYNPEKDSFDLDTYKKEAFSPTTKKVKDSVKEFWQRSNAKSKDVDLEGGKKLDLTKLKFEV